MKMLAMVAITAAATLCPTASVAATSSPNGAVGDNAVVVRFSSPSAMDDNLRRLSAGGARVKNRYEGVFFGASLSLSDTGLAELRSATGVAEIEPDVTVRVEEVQSPTGWHLDRLDQARLPLDGRYSYGTTGRAVRAYIVDSGVNASEPQLLGRVSTGYSSVKERATSDCSGHGTRVATIAAGGRDGVAKRAEVIPVRVLACDGRGSLSSVLQGLDWIIKQRRTHVEVANLSLTTAANELLDSAVQSLHDAGVLTVAAAGNAAAEACGFSPARAPVAITVGASDESDRRASFSNYGSCVDVWAPGVNLGIAGQGSEPVSGTSFAAPLATGAALRLLEEDPALGVARLHTKLTEMGVQRLRGDSSEPALLLRVPA